MHGYFDMGIQMHGVTYNQQHIKLHTAQRFNGILESTIKATLSITFYNI